MKKILLLFIPLMFFFGCEKEEENNNDNSTTGYSCIDNDCFAEEGGQYATLDDCLSVCDDYLSCYCGTATGTQYLEPAVVIGMYRDYDYAQGIVLWRTVSICENDFIIGDILDNGEEYLIPMDVDGDGIQDVDNYGNPFWLQETLICSFDDFGCPPPFWAQDIFDIYMITPFEYSNLIVTEIENNCSGESMTTCASLELGQTFCGYNFYSNQNIESNGYFDVSCQYILADCIDTTGGLSEDYFLVQTEWYNYGQSDKLQSMTTIFHNGVVYDNNNLPPCY